MTIGTQYLENAINGSIDAIDSAGATLLLLQVSSAMRDFDQGFVKSVANCAALPAASANKGRMIYLQDRCSYRLSDGVTWTSDFIVTQNYLLYSWGNNQFGRLGDNTTVSKSSPVSVVGGFTNWCQVGAGHGHSVGLRSNGTLWAWGCGGYGRLGNNSTVSASSPVSVVGGFTDWCLLDVGCAHNVAIRTNGTLWAWGVGTSGQLGNNAAVNTSSPVSVVGGFTDWCQASAGSIHTVGLRANGTVWTWGGNTSAQLGDNTIVNKSSPVSVVGGFTDWCQVSASATHTSAIRTNGTLWGWGNNGGGKLGNNSGSQTSSPVSAIGGFTDWCQVSAGSLHTVAVRRNGTLWAMGYNSQGVLGDNTIVAKSSPVSVVGGFTDWCRVSVPKSGAHTLALRTNGSLWAWGCANYGQLGDNTTVSKSSPVSVVGGFNDWCLASAGFGHSLAIRGEGF